MNWISLESHKQLDKLIDKSHSQRVVIFKHSTSCGISRMVLRNFEKDLSSTNPPEVEYYLLDLLAYRSISNQISEVFDVVHQSPQLLIIEKGTAVHHSSHSNIMASSLELA